MAPIAAQRIPTPPGARPDRVRSKATTRLVGPVKKLINLKVVLYVLLGTAAVFGFVLMCWKLGSLVRQFTRGRILRSRKSFRTRYIKTWYGWVPQDQYNSKRKAWKRVLGRSWRWFSWTDSNDDYSWVWWDSSRSRPGKEAQSEPRPLFQTIRHKDESPGSNLKPGIPRPGDRLVSMQTFGSCPVKTTKISRYPALGDGIGGSPSPVAKKCTPDTRISSYYSTYLTYPLHLKPPRSRLDSNCQGIHLRELDDIPSRPRPDAQWTCLTSANPYRVIAWRCRRSSNSKANELLLHWRNRRVKELRKWAVGMQIHGPRSLLPHHVSLGGCPGSPVSELLSRSSDRQSLLQYDDWDRSSFDMIRRRRRSLKSENTDHHPSGMSDCILVIKDDVPFLRQDGNIATTCTKSGHGTQAIALKHTFVDDLLDDELWFLDGLDRRLEWLLGECQPGRRGFRFPILPRTCVSKRPGIIYTDPSCASLELMRLHGGSKNLLESRKNKPDSKIPTTVSLGQPNTTQINPHINSWRAQINRWRRHRESEEIKSIGYCGSSVEEPPDNVLDPSSWILRRPPQGFPMSTRQKNAYYGRDGCRWGKLEDWQMIGE